MKNNKSTSNNNPLKIQFNHNISMDIGCVIQFMFQRENSLVVANYSVTQQYNNVTTIDIPFYEIFNATKESNNLIGTYNLIIKIEKFYIEYYHGTIHIYSKGFETIQPETITYFVGDKIENITIEDACSSLAPRMEYWSRSASPSIWYLFRAN